MSETGQAGQVKLEDSMINLADLIGFDMTNVQAKKFENLPEGLFEFEIQTDPMPGIYTVGDNPPKGASVLACKVLNVLSVKVPSETPDPTKLIGKVHRETNVINTGESLEYLQATLEAFGCQKGKLGDMLASLAGVRFTAAITHRVNKNNTDIVYAGLSKITKVQRPQGVTTAVA